MGLFITIQGRYKWDLSEFVPGRITVRQQYKVTVNALCKVTINGTFHSLGICAWARSCSSTCPCPDSHSQKFSALVNLHYKVQCPVIFTLQSSVPLICVLYEVQCPIILTLQCAVPYYIYGMSKNSVPYIIHYLSMFSQKFSKIQCPIKFTI